MTVQSPAFQSSGELKTADASGNMCPKRLFAL